MFWRLVVHTHSVQLGGDQCPDDFGGDETGLGRDQLQQGGGSEVSGFTCGGVRVTYRHICPIIPMGRANRTLGPWSLCVA